jgi:hypothetical protein
MTSSMAGAGGSALRVPPLETVDDRPTTEG